MMCVSAARAVLALTLLASVAPALPAMAQQGPANTGLEREIARLRWLDKTTGRVQTIDVPVTAAVRIQSLEIIVRSCVERPPEEPPESAAFLDISEIRPGEPTAEVFRGWMFASSPALSAMEHPVYDVWVLDCLNRDEAASTSSSDGAR